MRACVKLQSSSSARARSDKQVRLVSSASIQLLSDGSVPLSRNTPDSLKFAASNLSISTSSSAPPAHSVRLSVASLNYSVCLVVNSDNGTASEDSQGRGIVRKPAMRRPSFSAADLSFIVALEVEIDPTSRTSNSCFIVSLRQSGFIFRQSARLLTYMTLRTFSSPFHSLVVSPTT